MKSGNVVLNTLIQTVMQQVKVTVAAVCLTKLEMGLDFLFRLIYFAACLNQGGSWWHRRLKRWICHCGTLSWWKQPKRFRRAVFFSSSAAFHRGKNKARFPKTIVTDYNEKWTDQMYGWLLEPELAESQACWEPVPVQALEHFALAPEPVVPQSIP